VTKLLMSMVALGKSAKVSDAGIPPSWKKRWPSTDSPANGKRDDNTLSFDVGRYSVIYGFMPAPIPDLEPLCKNAPQWPEAAAEMQRHQQHVIVTVRGDGKPIEAMHVLTQATVALIDACDDAIGVFWFHSEMVTSAPQFCEIACEFVPKSPPLPLWVNVVVSKQSDGSLRGATKGLAALGLMEFESQNSPEPPEEFLGRLLGLSAYVIENGLIIKDGDTIGESERERIKVTYAPSAFGAEGNVMRLDYAASGETGVRMTSYGCWHSVATLAGTIAFGWWLYLVFPILRGSLFRHCMVVPLVLLFGVMLLMVSDRLLQRLFGFQAFETPKATDKPIQDA